MRTRDDLHILVKPSTKKELNALKAQLEANRTNRITTDETIRYLLNLAKKENNN